MTANTRKGSPLPTNNSRPSKSPGTPSTATGTTALHLQKLSREPYAEDGLLDAWHLWKVDLLLELNLDFVGVVLLHPCPVQALCAQHLDANPAHKTECLDVLPY